MAEGGTTNEGEEKGPPAGPAVPDEAPDGKARQAQEWERIYAPNFEHGEFKTQLAKRRIGKGPILSSRLFRGRPVRKEEATVPLSQALPGYADAAERAMNEGAIPAEYRERVRSYFDRLK